VKPFWAFVVRPEVNSVKELKNKVISMAGMAGGQHIATRVILKKYGLDPDKDVVFKAINAGSRLPGMMSGSMDAGLMEYGEAFRAKKNGFKILLNAADHYSILGGAIGAGTKKLREQPDQVKRFLRANVKGLRYMQDNRSAALETMMNWLKVDREMAEGIYDLSINNFTKDGTLDEATLQGVVNDQLAEVKIKDVPLSQVTDFAPLYQILKEPAFTR
jgi:ABC-type nitrate/sulfonate/bicarbonate transport system substrate-binding protein